MTTFTCREGGARLMDYLEEVLSPAERAAVDAHLAGCARCVAFVASYLATPRILRDATRVDLPAGARETLRRVLAGRRPS
ncbi:MAG TPA: zf-HC2 domain-containing protein [Candidatus Polarisedimenticolia bacterium]|nr:zf-HC2 domain-containing protein [Candidatus Polarisedimenticolia bacterium]